MMTLRHNVTRSTLLVAVICLLSCDRTPKTQTTTDYSGKSHTEAQPFKGEIYRTHDNISSITLISPEELEFRANGTTFLCKYSRQPDGLRVILTALGSQQVLYFRS